jgi:hypothetical protein
MQEAERSPPEVFLSYRGVAAIPDAARQRGEGHAAGVARSAAEGEEGGCPPAGGTTSKSSPTVSFSPAGF